MKRVAQRRVPGQVPARVRAFTAYETLVAVAVLAMIVAAASSALSAGRAQGQYAQELIDGGTLARDLLETVLRDPSNVQSYQGYTDGPNNIMDQASQLYPDEFQAYTRTVTIASAARTVVTPMWPQVPSGYDVTVTVSRDGRQVAKLTRFVLVPTN